MQRSTGLWLQPLGNGRYMRSPLVTSSLAESLDPKTRKGVHYVLGARILARKSIAPIEVFTCVNHLLMAEEVTFAVLVVIQALTALSQLKERVEDDFGFARMWSSERLSEVDPNLQLFLRAIQVTVLAKQGHDIRPMIQRIDALVAELGGEGWGVAGASGMLSVNLVWDFPTLANKFLLVALRSYPNARMLDGSALPIGKDPLEILLWMSAYSCKSDAEVDSWLETISQFTVPANGRQCHDLLRRNLATNSSQAGR